MRTSFIADSGGRCGERLLGADLEMPGRLPSPAMKKGPSPHAAPVSSQKIADAMAEFFKRHKPAQRQEQIRFHPGPRPQPARSRLIDLRRMTARSEMARTASSCRSMTVSSSRRTDDGFVIIDQHALHESMLYEDLCKRIRNGKLQSQKLLIPESFEVTPSAAQAIEDNAELLETLEH